MSHDLWYTYWGQVSIWGNDDTFWVANDGDGAANKLYAYNRSDGSRDTTADFDTLNAAGNESLRGVCSDGATMFVTDHSDDKIYAYKMSDTTRDSGKDVTLNSANNNPQGLWCDSSHLWVAEDNNNLTSKIFVYQRSDGSHVSGMDITAATMNPSTTVGAINNNDQRGMWSNGTTLFVVDDEDDQIYGYKLSDRTRDDEKNLSLDTDNTNPEGLWFDGRVLWVVDSTDDKVYVYDLPGAQPDNTPAAGVPTLDATPQKDIELTADVSGITDSTDGLDNVLYLYQWIRVDGADETELAGETGSTYTTTDDDVGKNIKVRVIFDDDAGNQEYPRYSPEIGPVLGTPPTVSSVEFTSICDRSPAIQEAIMFRLGGLDSCSDATLAHIGNIETLHISRELGTLRSGDLVGLSSLKSLTIYGTNLHTIESGAFAPVNHTLTSATFTQNKLEPSDLSELTSGLKGLSLAHNNITSLGASAFSRFTKLEDLGLWGNPITSLDVDAFDGLSSLRSLALGGYNPPDGFRQRTQAARSVGRPLRRQRQPAGARPLQQPDLDHTE